MPKRNFDVPCLGLDGKPLLDPVMESGRPVIVDGEQQFAPYLIKQLIANCLIAKCPGDEALEGSKWIGIFSLAQRVMEGGLREYTVDELTLIKNRVKDCGNTSILGFSRVCEVVDADL